MLGQLLRKDLYLIRFPLLVSAVLICGGLALGYAFVSDMSRREAIEPDLETACLLATGGYFGLLLNQISIGILSGMTFSSERADRSTEFLAYLPPCRRDLMTSKALVLAGVVLLIWAVNAALISSGEMLASELGSASVFIQSLPPLGTLFCVTILSVGVGWWGSARAASNGPPVAFACLAPVLTYAAIRTTQRTVDLPSNEAFEAVFNGVNLTVGIGCLILGSQHFLTREEL